MGAGFGISSGESSIIVAAAVIGTAVLLWALYAIRRMSRQDVAARRRIADLEIRLNEAEVALASEPHVLVIWRGR
ncbi:MAG: hypothetical protein KDK75_17605, partial [Alphaproteobacteria bacterium]|nr:hypothetical protein [Alphaproteobacteria bacterium]